MFIPPRTICFPVRWFFITQSTLRDRPTFPLAPVPPVSTLRVGQITLTSSALMRLRVCVFKYIVNVAECLTMLTFLYVE